MSESLERVRAVLADRYAVHSEVGSGGMATVYLARDLKHERRVALKVLRPELAAAIGAQRFLQEIRITAGLNHPHILPLLDSGEADGLLYYVMPYVAGGSLRALLASEAPLELGLALHITRQVAAALDHAHRQHVIHRDIKPENILFSEGHSIVADFGIAKAISAAGGAALTRSGVPLGTPGYMSPEQAMGFAELGERTDVYGLACVVYEMLVGATPMAWPTEESLRLGRMIDAPPLHRERLDRLPGRLEQVLTRALAARPSDRFATPLEFVEALGKAAEGSAKLSDSEVREIIERAAQLEIEQPTQEGALSIGSVEQVAAEVGIAPQRVRQAARELDYSDSEVARMPAGGGAIAEFRRDTLLLDRTVEGEVPDSAFPVLVDEIQRRLETAGHVSVLGKSLTWSPAAPGSEERKVVVTIAAEAGRTRIHIEERLELSGWRIFIPAWGVGGGIIAGLLLSQLAQAPDRALMFTALSLGAVGGYMAVRTFVWLRRGRAEPQLTRLADRLAALAERAFRGLLEP
ncbi:MAG: serine/threonine protein kinase [Gemmatimonadota bacterium]|nr:MAG: serine/threonine protein kinase [Gemmatimonadota bacterium]